MEFVIPVFLLVSAWLFPLGTMFYWLVSNIYTLVQQLIIINRMPTPGSEAALAREARIETVFRYANVYDRAISLIAAGKVDLSPLISATIPFADSIAAFDRAVEARDTADLPERAPAFFFVDIQPDQNRNRLGI